MPTATGTARSAVDLLNKLNTFLTSNGWSRLRGETDLACASPKAARYWRLLVWETTSINESSREIKKIEWRTTVNGANVATNAGSYSFSAIETVGDLVAGTTAVSPDIGSNGIWWVQYDFGAATMIREIVIQADDHDNAPAAFAIQWSNDAFSWTTMQTHRYQQRFTQDDMSLTFTWADGFRESQHYSDSIPRRGGFTAAATSGGGHSPGRYEEWCNDIWAWQGPGYDAARRVYVAAMPGHFLSTSDEYVSFTGSIGVDLSLNANDWWLNQEGALANNIISNCPTLNIAAGNAPYWFYCNSHRFIVVARSGTDDYTMAYCGFLAAFGKPDDWPFPLFIGASSSDQASSLGDTGTRVRDAQDPTLGAAWYRRWDNIWRRVENHELDNVRDIDWTTSIYDPDSVLWPKHPGIVGNAGFPESLIGSASGGYSHWLDHCDPTEQNDLPIVPAMLLDRYSGFVGALADVFTVPGGGILAPEATFAIGADTYRVFTTRDHSEGNAYYCIKEV